MHDLAVFMPDARELDPFHRHAQHWQLDGKDVMPRLHHGYVFAGCRGGVLYATALAPPSLEQVVAALWELAELARQRWVPVGTAWISEAELRRRARRRRLARLGFVAIVVAIVLLLRR